MRMYPMILRSSLVERPLLSVDPFSTIRVFQGHRLLISIFVERPLTSKCIIIIHWEY
jgi:hypothetical protein